MRGSRCVSDMSMCLTGIGVFSPMRMAMNKALIILTIFLMAFEVSAEKEKTPEKPALCESNIITSTNYYTPSALKICGKWYYGKVRRQKTPWEFDATQTVCPEFQKEVRMEGSGRYNENEIYTYAREVMVMSGPEKKKGTPCPTSVGRYNRCLLTYISVAADPLYHVVGDIISVPAMKGKKVTLPDGSTFTHPGYFRVDDTGSKIKGPNRFDFYSGNMTQKDKLNTFGDFGPKDISMSEKTDCLKRKTFTSYSKKTQPAQVAEAEKAIAAAIKDITFDSIIGKKPAAKPAEGVPLQNRINNGKGIGIVN